MYPEKQKDFVLFYGRRIAYSRTKIFIHIKTKKLLLLPVHIKIKVTNVSKKYHLYIECPISIKKFDTVKSKLTNILGIQK